MSTTVRWDSPLGVGVALLLSCSVVYALIAIAGTVLTHRYGVASPQTNEQFVFGPKADALFFGRPPREVVRDNPMVGRLALIFIDFMTGFMLAFGIVLFGVIWFGLRHGQEWALWVAVLGNAAMLVYYWGLAVLPFMREFGFGYGDIFHPFAAYPTLIVPVAAVLSWVGLRAA
jgi:hypothetical protein